MNTNNTENFQNKERQSICTRTFESPEGQIKNSYLCNQPRFTVSDSWNLLKRRRQFSKKA